MNFGVNTDVVFSSVVSNRQLKVPSYKTLSAVGNNTGMIGNIILLKSTSELCYHNGDHWIIVSSSVAGAGLGTTSMIQGTSTALVAGDVVNSAPFVQSNFIAPSISYGSELDVVAGAITYTGSIAKLVQIFVTRVSQATSTGTYTTGIQYSLLKNGVTTIDSGSVTLAPNVTFNTGVFSIPNTFETVQLFDPGDSFVALFKRVGQSAAPETESYSVASYIVKVLEEE